VEAQFAERREDVPHHGERHGLRMRGFPPVVNARECGKLALDTPSPPANFPHFAGGSGQRGIWRGRGCADTLGTP
jgi:hypothetical protein